MTRSGSVLNIVLRNLAGLLVLVGAHYASDQYYFHQRTGFNKTSPYVFLLFLYGWIVFHNRFLFERMYLKGKRAAYLFWTILVMTVSSFNMHFTLQYGFDVSYTLPHILSFWVYTFAGLGVYVMSKYLGGSTKENLPAIVTSTDALKPTTFTFLSEGIKREIALSSVIYVESLENYVKVITSQKTFLARLSLKEAEDRLPKPEFIRISRSHIVNSGYLSLNGPDAVKVKEHNFRIGKVYKRYVEEQLAALKKR